MSIKKKLKKAAQRYGRKHPRFRKFYKKSIYLWRRWKYFWYGRGIVPDEKTIVFDSFKGKNWGCTPRTIYEYMISHEEFSDWKFFCVISRDGHADLENPQTTLIRRSGRVYIQSMHRAKYWITNYRVPEYVWPRAGQIYVECWHGTPLKRLGYDLETSENAIDSLQDIRRKYDMDADKFSYILSSSPFCTEKFLSAWNLKGRGMEDKVLEIGFPRNDFLVNFQETDTTSIFASLGIPKGKRVILYAPTWRDNQHQSGVGFVYELNLNFQRWQETLGKDYVVLFRAHYLVADSFNFDAYKGFVFNVSRYDNINDLYIISDLLITDYSSVFFDYAILKRPILFYMYDLNNYREKLRGFYFDINELPGEIITEEPELLKAIPQSINCFNYNEKYQSFNNKFNRENDGMATERFIKKVFPDEQSN